MSKLSEFEKVYFSIEHTYNIYANKTLYINLRELLKLVTRFNKSQSMTTLVKIREYVRILYFDESKRDNKIYYCKNNTRYVIADINLEPID